MVSSFHTNMEIKKSELALVQQLYVLQMELDELLEQDLKDPETRKHARRQMKEFTQLLKRVDPQYMGGDDVYLALKEIRESIARKIQASSIPRRTAKNPKKKAVSSTRKPAKKTVKKSSKKKVTKKTKKVTSKPKKATTKKPAKKKAVSKKKR
mgnify:CR=1 FL=1